MPHVASGMESFTYTWKIENFSSWVQKRGERVRSPWFTAETLDETVWRLDLYPRGIDNGTEICISCYLCRAENDRGDEYVTVGYEFEILGMDQSTLLSKRVESFAFKKKESLGWPDFKSLNEIFRDKAIFLPKDVLTIRCHMWGSFPEILRATRCSALTEIGVGGCSFKWNIKMSSLETPIHYYVPGPWRIELTFFVADDENVTFKIRKFGEVSFRYILHCKVTLLDAKGTSREVRQSKHLIEPKQEVKIFEYPPFIKKSKLVEEKSGILSDDVACFYCEFSILNEVDTFIETEPKIETLNVSDPAPEIDLDFSNLRTDLGRMFANKTFTDVKLKAGNKTFCVHKALLSVRSSVLADKISNMSSSPENDYLCVDVPDLSSDTMESLLKFMYTGVLEDLDRDSATNLFIAASKYKVHSLKERYTSYLKSTLSGSSVCDILTLADEHCEEDLKIAAQNYIREHTNEVLLSNEWKQLIENNVNLVTETLCKLSIEIGTN